MRTMINKLQKFYQNHKELLLSLAVIAIFVVLGMSDAWADSGAENEKGETSTVIGKVRERAIVVIEHIKAIAYIMGGFGLIGLAWGAIFGKINWKWFGSLAIGLFIISWMGMTIDYFTRRGDVGIAATAFKTTGPSGVGCTGDCFGDKAAGLLGGAAVDGAADSNAGSDQNLTPEQQQANEEAQKKEQERQQWCSSHFTQCIGCGSTAITTECKDCQKNHCNDSGYSGNSNDEVDKCKGCDSTGCLVVSANYTTCMKNNCCPNNQNSSSNSDSNDSNAGNSSSDDEPTGNPNVDRWSSTDKCEGCKGDNGYCSAKGTLEYQDCVDDNCCE